VYIGSGARIEAGSVLRGPVWVGNGCRVDAGACVERSVLFDYAHIGARATAREMIVSGSYCVTRDGAAAPAAANGSHWWGDARALAAPAAAIRRVA
jgi:mannose-1-phosphate guanylyltransferase